MYLNLNLNIAKKQPALWKSDSKTERSINVHPIIYMDLSAESNGMVLPVMKCTEQKEYNSFQRISAFSGIEAGQVQVEINRKMLYVCNIFHNHLS